MLRELICATKTHETNHMPEQLEFIAGVIEGFYGEPWTQAERLELFERMTHWGLNTYFYGPKDDLKHRAIWRDLYTASETETLSQIITACNQRNLRFIYGLGPGLDIRYSEEADFAFLNRRFEQMLALGCRNFAVLFDDIPDRMNPNDAQRFSSVASAQCHLTNALLQATRARCADVRFFFCPTPYCGRMAEAGLGGVDYLSILGKELHPDIEIFWTGQEIISQEITVSSIQTLQGYLRRKPLLWDNLHANDYDVRRFFCGPYSGRPIELREHVSGLMLNANNEFPLNFIPFHTLAAFVKCVGPWDPRAAYLDAIQEWLPSFEMIHGSVTSDELILLGDCYYLPLQEGPQAELLYNNARILMGSRTLDWENAAAEFQRQSTQLKAFCVRLTELRHRRLFYALSRRIWELREELDFLERYLVFRMTHDAPHPEFNSEFHHWGTYRGGIVPRLQRLLARQPNGAFQPTEPALRA